MYHASSTCCKIGGCKYFWSQKTFIVPERLLSVIYERLNHHITSWCLLATCPIFGMFVVGAPLFLLISFQIRAKTNNISLLTMIFLHEIFPWFLSSHCLLCCIHVEKKAGGTCTIHCNPAPETFSLRFPVWLGAYQKILSHQLLGSGIACFKVLTVQNCMHGDLHVYFWLTSYHTIFPWWLSISTTFW